MNKKRIKILTTGVIKVKGYINGPVLTPYYETIDDIIKLLIAGIKVVEVLDDGSEVALNLNNVSSSNDDEKSAPGVDETPASVVEPVESKLEETPQVEEIDTRISEDVAPTTTSTVESVEAATTTDVSAVDVVLTEDTSAVEIETDEEKSAFHQPNYKKNYNNKKKHR